MLQITEEEERVLLVLNVKGSTKMNEKIVLTAKKHVCLMQVVLHRQLIRHGPGAWNQNPFAPNGWKNRRTQYFLLTQPTKALLFLNLHQIPSQIKGEIYYRQLFL